MLSSYLSRTLKSPVKYSVPLRAFITSWAHVPQGILFKKKSAIEFKKKKKFHM